MLATKPLSDKESRSRRLLRPEWIFYGVIPSLTAILFGVNHSGSARHMAVLPGIVYWLGIIFALWLLLDIASRIAVKVATRWNFPRLLAIFIASLIGVFIFDPVLTLYSSLTLSMLTDGVDYTQPNTAWNMLRNNPGQLVLLLVVPLYWFACLFVSDRLFGFPGYFTRVRPHSRTSRSWPLTNEKEEILPVPQEGLFADVPIGIGTDLISIHAEDHYVRVVTKHGEALVRYRFSDALAEVSNGLQGTQIHRSHWVRAEAIADMRVINGKRQIELKDGRLLPISRSHIGILRSLGFR